MRIVSRRSRAFFDVCLNVYIDTSNASRGNMSHNQLQGIVLTPSYDPGNLESGTFTSREGASSTI